MVVVVAVVVIGEGGDIIAMVVQAQRKSDLFMVVD